jgi:hypothetical protein
MNRSAIENHFAEKATEARAEARKDIAYALKELDADDGEDDGVTGYLLDAIGHIGEFRAWQRAARDLSQGEIDDVDERSRRRPRLVRP